MKHYIISGLLIIIAIAGFYSCSLIFEKPITNETMTVYTPADSAKVSVYSQQFYWEPVPRATMYRLQIASPNFASILTMVLDTTITTTKFNMSLNPGTYQWRVRAENSGSQTNYVTRTLTVLTGLYKNQSVGVLSPSSDTSIYTGSINFSWSALINSQYYVIEIDTATGDFTSSKNDTIRNGLLSNTIVLSKRGSYKWRISGDSGGVSSLYSSPLTITYGLDSVSLTSPLANATSLSTSTAISLNWSAPTNAPDASKLTYIVYLYGSDGVTKVTGYPLSPTPSTSTTYSAGILTSGVYYWSVQAVDANGYKGLMSVKRQFTISL